MANLPEKNVVLVDKITNVPTDSNLFINANGEFKQASVNDVVNSSTVVSTAVETAINTAVQDSIDSNFKQTSGSPILLTDSAEGVLLDFKAYGRSTQKQYSGKNLLENTATTTSLNGGTFTVNEDGSVNAKGTFTDTTEFSIGTYNATESSILSGCPSGGSENTYQLRSSGIGADYGGGLGITAGSNTSIYIRVMSGQTVNITFKPMIRLASITDDTYEPYVGGTSSPNPDYPQAIDSVADGGYFDGELLQGYYNESGTFSSNTSYVCSKNQIPCNGGDTIKLTYGSTARIINFIFFDENGVFLSNASATNTTVGSVTAPTNASYFAFNVNESATSALTPSTAKHITVTINGKYALINKSKGKNWVDVSSLSWKANNASLILIDKVHLTPNAYTLSWIQDKTLASVTRNTPCYNKTSNSDVIYQNSSENHNLQAGKYNWTFTIKEEDDYSLQYWIHTPNVDVSISNIQLEVGTVTTDYEPYKEEVKYIPLNEPLRSSLDGTVTDEISLSENKVTRRIVRKRIVTVSKNNSTDVNNYCYYCPLENVGRSYSGMSNNLPILSVYELSINGTENIGQAVSVEYGGLVYINVGKLLTENTVEGMTKWLSENPTYIQYELAEPITETIEPVDIVTYDNVTYLTASDNAEMELEYPTSKVAGIASIGYSKGRKAEYEVELLKAQLLELQTAMVNSL